MARSAPRENSHLAPTPDPNPAPDTPTPADRRDAAGATLYCYLHPEATTAWPAWRDLPELEREQLRAAAWPIALAGGAR